MNQNVPLTLGGEVTPRTVIYKSESHKLHQAFCVKEDAKILKSMPVALTEDGEIEPFTGADKQVYLGVAVTDNVNPAYKAQRNFPVEVTVMVEAFAICNYVAGADSVKCGYVKPNGNTVNDRFISVDASTDPTHFINITPVEEANDIIQVLIR